MTRAIGMTFWYANEFWADESSDRTAGNKARNDLVTVLQRCGLKPLDVPISDGAKRGAGVISKLKSHYDARKAWRNVLKGTEPGDAVLFQIPLVMHTVFFEDIIKECKARGVKTALFIHDIELLRHANRGEISQKARKRIEAEECGPVQQCDVVVAHNESMKKHLVDTLGICGEKVVSLGIFDYLHEDDEIDNAKFAKELPIVITGNLNRHKAEYAYHLPRCCKFNLYGIGYAAPKQENVRYHGSFAPSDLPAAIEGSFGLVWDGDNAETCSGAYGEYLRKNNPHKTSFYLSIGLPVIIWEHAALAPFIAERGAGIAVSSLTSIPQAVAGLSEQNYERMKARAREVGCELRAGAFSERAIQKVEALLNSNA